MTEKPLHHPEREKLVAFGLGKLESDEATKIETHLGECDACCETLLDLKDDTFVELVRKSPQLKQPTHDSNDNLSSGEIDPADAVATDDSITIETMLVESGVSRGAPDLPAQLADHLRYRIIELIGKGGMGDVYKAEHRLMDRLVALKLINQDLVKNKKAVERFRREVRAAARLTHPNIVTAHDAEQAGDIHFLAMEFVEGLNLANEVQNRGPLPIAEACDYIRQAAEGLQHAHEKGMVHRDIKPHNLMLSSDGQLRILDFGLASFATESALMEADDTDSKEATPTPRHLTTLGSVMGTPDYIAPEQSRDAHSADIRADIYSLGCTLYFLLSGRTPHKSGSVVDKLKAHAEQEPDAIEAACVDVPEKLAEVIRRMMAKDPAERFQTPADVANALAPFVEIHRSDGGKPVDSASARRMHGPLADNVEDKRRWPLIIITTACLLMGICAAGIFFVQLGSTTLKFEIDDPHLAVRFRDETISIDNDGQTIHIKPGTEQEFVVEQNGVEVESDSMTLRKGDKVVLRVSLANGEVSVDQTGAEIPIRSLSIAQSKREKPTAPLKAGGILTSPPAVPQGGLPVGRNLISDPSLENTELGRLPRNWSAWLDDGPDFKCEVVEGGVTGKRCLRITGKGTRGVVFCTSIPMDRTKRYALKGSVKLAGDTTSWAVIKINYFNKTGWLGVDDRVGVKSGESGWQFFEKTDRSDAFPEATLIVPACHIEGNGTAWFDDLEVIAYDRNKLPEDFDKKHGRNNRTYSLE